MSYFAKSAEFGKQDPVFSLRKMSLGWDSLPLLPLRCILEHLSLEDALSALSVCRHWRSAILLYEGCKETLKLRAKQLDRNLHLARLFRKHTKRLHIYIDCSNEELDKFLTYVLPQFFDTLDLQEILFIGPNYAQLSLNSSSVVKLNRILTESLVFKHLHSIRSLALLGCQMDTVKSENDRFMNKHTEYYARPLSFSNASSPGDAILSQCNASLMMYSALRHIIVEYEQVNTAALETLSNLAQFSLLSLNICSNRRNQLLPIDWRRVHSLYSNGLEVALSIIGVNQRKLDEIINSVLVEDMMLVSLKVMFCKTFYGALIAHAVSLYDATLRELVWADSPCDSSRREIPSSAWYEGCAVNPLMVLCWRCKQLRRLVVHGYWIWQYDVVGIVRLRRKLESLEISAIYSKQSRFPNSQSDPGCAVRVLALDHPKTVDDGYVQELNQYTEFKWSPTRWQHLHPALRARASPAQRAHYALSEATREPPAIAMYEE